MTPQERVLTRSLVSSGTVRLPATLHVRNAITHRIARLASARSEFGSLQRHLERMVALVEEERSSLPIVSAF